MDSRLAEISPDIQIALSDEGAQVGLQTWNLLKQGYDRFTISRRLKLPQELVDNILERFRECVAAEAGRMIQHYRLLDSERVEDLITHWWPVATGCSLDKILAGEISEDDFEHCLKAGYVILSAIEKRMNILVAGQAQKISKAAAQREMLVGLQSALTGGNGDGAASTREGLVLESDAEKLQ
jgi:hypothetical protein